MPTNRCGHFSLEVEEVSVPLAAVVVRVPIRRCALAEHMIGILAHSDEGNQIAQKLQIAASRRDADTYGEQVRVAFGPDLDVIHATECTVQRCQESCTPSYRLLLQQFGFDEDAARETGEGCLEIVAQAIVEAGPVAK